MDPEVQKAVPLSLLDTVSAWMDSPERPLSFCQILELQESAPGHEALSQAAISAKCAFARTGSVVAEDCWIWQPMMDFEVREGVPEDEVDLAIAAFLLKPVALESENPIQQLYLDTGRCRVLVTKAHHAVCDGMGLLQWLDHQFQVALGESDAVDEPVYREPLLLRHHPSGGVRKSPEARWGSSRLLWRRGNEGSPERHWASLTLDAEAIRESLNPDEGLRLNDVLAGACLGAMADWNIHHGQSDAGLSLWHPVNIREAPFEGVGNGSSRVRVYWQRGLSTADAAVTVRRQMDWAREKGEWHVPESALFRAPDWIRRRLVCAVLRRPWVDMGSMLFSHMEKQGPHGERVLSSAKRMDWVGMLDKRFPAGFVGATSGGTTWLTLCWDPALWSSEDAAQFLALYEQRIQEFLGHD